MPKASGKRRQKKYASSSLVDLLGLLRSEPRRRILIQLAAGPKDVATLAAEVKLSASTVRYHLGRLRDRRLVHVRRVAKRCLYRHSPNVSAIVGRQRVILRVATPDGSQVTLMTPAQVGGRQARYQQTARPTGRSS